MKRFKNPGLSRGQFARFAVTAAGGSLLLLTTLPLFAQSPAPYPGSVTAKQGDDSTYLLEAPCDTVAAFYREAIGEATSDRQFGGSKTRPAGHPARQLTFVYRSTPTQHSTLLHTAVRISYRYNTDNAYDKVMQELESNMKRGFLTRQRLSEIKEQYRPLQDVYYRDTGDGPADLSIFSLHRDFLRTGIWMDTDEFAQKALQLAMEGRQEELMEMQSQMASGTEDHMKLQQTAAQVDFWIECLDKIKEASTAHGFPLMIELKYTYRTSEGFKG